MGVSTKLQEEKLSRFSLHVLKLVYCIKMYNIRFYILLPTFSLATRNPPAATLGHSLGPYGLGWPWADPTRPSARARPRVGYETPGLPSGRWRPSLELRCGKLLGDSTGDFLDLQTKKLPVPSISMIFFDWAYWKQISAISISITCDGKQNGIGLVA